MLYYIVSNYIFEKPLIEDVVHDTFLKLIPQVSKLQTFDENRLRAYISATARNTAYTSSSKLKKMRSILITDDSETLLTEIPDNCLPYDELLIKHESTKKIFSIIQKLAPNERFLLESKYIEQLSDNEIASTLHVKPSSIRMMLTRVRRKVLTQLINEGDKNGQNQSETPR